MIPQGLIDIHPHVISHDEARYPRKPLEGMQSAWSQERPADWPELSAAMTEAGVAKAAVVQSSTTYGHDNSYLADTVDEAPDRLAGVCSIGFLDENSVDSLEYWIGERGLAGARIFSASSTVAQLPWLDDDRTRKAWAWVAERSIPTCVQARHSALPQLQNVLRQFPGLRLVLDHALMTDFPVGPPYDAEALYRLADEPGVFLKLTTRNLLSAQPSEGGPKAAVAELVSRFGSDRIAWGSNWPASPGTLADCVGMLDDALAGLAPSDVTNICGATAVALYPALA